MKQLLEVNSVHYAVLTLSRFTSTINPKLSKMWILQRLDVMRDCPFEHWHMMDMSPRSTASTSFAGIQDPWWVKYCTFSAYKFLLPTDLRDASLFH